MDSSRIIHRWRNRKSSRVARSGAAVAEFAVCLPVIMVIVLAAIEACSMIFLRQALQATAYEAVRVAVAPARTTAEILNRPQDVLTCASEMLDKRKIQQGTVQLDPSNPAEATAGSRVTVSVTAPVDSNRLMPPWFFGSGNVTVNCVMLKEANQVWSVATGGPTCSILAFLTYGLGF